MCGELRGLQVNGVTCIKLNMGMRSGGNICLNATIHCDFIFEYTENAPSSHDFFLPLHCIGAFPTSPFFVSCSSATVSLQAKDPASLKWCRACPASSQIADFIGRRQSVFCNHCPLSAKEQSAGMDFSLELCYQAKGSGRGQYCLRYELSFPALF